MFIKEDFKMDFNKIKEAAQNYEADMTKFLREIVKFPGESCGEKDHIERIAEEMRKLDFDKVEIDPQGNVLGYMGTGETLIGFDAHIDTVGIGNRDNWNSIHMKDSNLTQRSEDVVLLISSEVSSLQFTVQGS